MILTEEQRDDVVRRLRSGLDPRAVYLFGSQASGKADSETSDVDLCVVVADGIDDVYRQTVDAYRSLRGLPFSKDIVVRREADFHERSQWLNSLECEIRKTGKLIFGA